MAKRKWNWRYRFFVAHSMSIRDFRKLQQFCEDHFDLCHDQPADRWDWSAPIRNSNHGLKTFDNVRLFFRSQEDFVMFKLLYNPDELYGQQ